MPINLKELFIADSNQIRIEKINYNFDQIIAVGGQIGPKGQKGDFGPIGPEGEKGQKGEQGPIGIAGSDGADGINFWADIEHDNVSGLVNAYNSRILKPVTFGTSHVTSVYLGDPNFDGGSNLGDTSPRSILTIHKDNQFENHLKIVGKNTNLVIRSEYFIDPEIYGGDVFSIKKDDVLGVSPAKLDIAFTDIVLNATGNDPKGILSLTSNNKIEFIATGGVFINQGTKAYFNDRLFVNENLVVNGTGFTKVSSGTTAQRDAIATADLLPGSIRYNTTTNKFEGRYSGVFGGSAWLPFRELTDSDQDTRVEIPISTDEDVIRMYTNGNLAMRIGGSTISLTPNSAAGNNLKNPIVANYTLFANENVHINQFGKGLSFKEGSGGNSPAPNYGSSINNRTLSDFYQMTPSFFNYDELGNWETLTTPDSGTSSDTHGIPSNDAIMTNVLFYSEGGNTTGSGNVVCSLDTTKTTIAYTKIGNMVTAFVNIVYGSTSNTISNTDNKMSDTNATGTLGLRLPGILNKYTPLHNLKFPIHFSNIRLNNAGGTSSSFFGFIESGNSFIKLMAKQESSTSDNNFFNIRTGSIGSSVEFQEFGLPKTLNFTFTYLTGDNAYSNPPIVSENQQGEGIG